MNFSIAPIHNSGHYKQDSSYIQQNQDKTPQNNRIKTNAVYPHQVHSLQWELQKQVLQEGITLARGSVLWRTLDETCQT